MDKIPLMGFTRGIFEIFIPGVFLLLNFYVAIYLLEFEDDFLNKIIKNNELFFILLVISFSYFLGVILRLLRAEIADKSSANFLFILRFKLKPFFIFISKLLYRFPKDGYDDHSGHSNQQENQPSESDSDAKVDTGRNDDQGPEDDTYLTDNFPYDVWIKAEYKNYERFPNEIESFISNKWKSISSESFNFIKTMLICEDEVAAKEIYAAESLSRYISGMLYGLTIASVILSLTACYSRFLNPEKDIKFILSLFTIYLFGIVIILWNFRYIRIKEVGTVFAIAYKYRDRLFNSKSSDGAPKSRSNTEDPG